MNKMRTRIVIPLIAALLLGTAIHAQDNTARRNAATTHGKN